MEFEILNFMIGILMLFIDIFREVLEWILWLILLFLLMTIYTECFRLVRILGLFKWMNNIEVSLVLGNIVIVIVIVYRLENVII